jgi:DNA-binding MarR family transcriptional regulator
MSDWNFFLAKRLLREFERSKLRFIHSIQDLDLVWAIGYGQCIGKPVGMKELSTGEFGAPKTVQRRLERLRRLGVVEQEPSDGDGRRIQLYLSPATLERLAEYKSFIVQNGMESRDPLLRRSA